MSLINTSSCELQISQSENRKRKSELSKGINIHLFIVIIIFNIHRPGKEKLHWTLFFLRGLYTFVKLQCQSCTDGYLL